MICKSVKSAEYYCRFVNSKFLIHWDSGYFIFLHIHVLGFYLLFVHEQLLKIAGDFCGFRREIQTLEGLQVEEKFRKDRWQNVFRALRPSSHFCPTSFTATPPPYPSSLPSSPKKLFLNFFLKKNPLKKINWFFK